MDGWRKRPPCSSQRFAKRAAVSDRASRSVEQAGPGSRPTGDGASCSITSGGARGECSRAARRQANTRRGWCASASGDGDVSPAFERGGSLPRWGVQDQPAFPSTLRRGNRLSRGSWSKQAERGQAPADGAALQAGWSARALLDRRWPPPGAVDQDGRWGSCEWSNGTIHRMLGIGGRAGERLCSRLWRKRLGSPAAARC